VGVLTHETQLIRATLTLTRTSQ